MVELLLEVFVIDPKYWKDGRSDKPQSTILYFLLVLFFGAVVQFVLRDNYVLSYMVFALSLRFAVFNYIMNYSTVAKHRKKWDYLGDNWWDNLKKNIFIPWRQLLEAWVLLVGIMQYLYFNGTIYGEYSIFGLTPFK